MAPSGPPASLLAAPAAEVQGRIVRARQALGPRLVVLGHHYQRDDVFRHADFTGDSFKLAQLARTRPEAEFIVFCGVHFMAESADVLAEPRQAVILPDLGAGCSMADMADEAQVEECWARVTAIGGDDVLPVTYMNSSAALKAFVGRHGGCVCTSSNARAVLEWAFARKPRVLFFPDQHLGRNTGSRMGIPLEAMPLWRPFEPGGGLDEATVRAARVLLWDGHCCVHTRFTPEMVDERRARFPGLRVVVHPECAFEVAEKADAIASTEGILDLVRQSPPGAAWAVGTEPNMVDRLAREQEGQRLVVGLDDRFVPCRTMERIDPADLLWVLEGLLEGEVRNRVRVPEAVAAQARRALERMLEIR